MSAIRYFFIVLVFFVASLEYTSAEKLECNKSFENLFMSALRKCASEMGISEDEMPTVKKNHNIDDCMLSCVFQKMGVLATRK
uniref:Odorant binding protein n=1 Tax=Dendrolimus kikuchii TaxID=765133 RepID=A0A076E7C5_9NEOP|nr:odorant binding protein [Dendrolimus kikuchii]